jgi:hypothetical protein
MKYCFQNYIFKTFIIFTTLLIVHLAYIGFNILQEETGYNDPIYKLIGIRRQGQLNLTASLFFIISTAMFVVFIVKKIKENIVSSDNRIYIIILFNLMFLNIIAASSPAILTEFHPDFWLRIFCYIGGILFVLNLVVFFVINKPKFKNSSILILSALIFLSVLLFYLFLLDQYIKYLLFIQVLICCVLFSFIIFVMYISSKNNLIIKRMIFIFFISAMAPALNIAIYNKLNTSNIDTEKYANFLFNEKPDIHLVSVETLIPPSLAKKHLGIEHLPFTDVRFEGSGIFKNVFSAHASTYQSLNAMMRLANVEFRTPYKIFEKPVSESYFSGIHDSPVARVLRENGYQVWTGDTGNTEGAMSGPYIHQPKLKKTVSLPLSHFCLASLKARYALFFLCPVFEFFHDGTVPDSRNQNKKLIERYSAIELNDPPQFKFYHAMEMTGHAGFNHDVFSKVMNAKFSRKYRSGSNEVHDYLSAIVNRIRKNGRPSIVFVFGDHGMRRTTSLPVETDPLLYVTDQHGVFAMIAFNNSSCSMEKFRHYSGDGFQTPNRILASIIRCLMQNKTSFDYLMNFSEDFDFSMYLYE